MSQDNIKTDLRGGDHRIRLAQVNMALKLSVPNKQKACNHSCYSQDALSLEGKTKITLNGNLLRE